MSIKSFSQSQARAVGFVFGASNLAITTDKSLFDIVKKYATEETDVVEWNFIANSIRNVLSRFTESDLDFRAMLQEVDDWLKKTYANDEYILKAWEKDCKTYGVPEKHIFAGEED